MVNVTKSLQGSAIPNEYRRVGRILEIVQLIALSPRHWKRKTLAEHYSVSERQIQKDLEIIRYRLGLPLQHDGTGYYFERMPELPALRYTFSEALALLLAVQAARQVFGIGSAELAAAVARLEALFPPEFTPLLQHITKEPVVTAHQEHRKEMLMLLHRALFEGRKVRMVYETPSRGEATERVVRPYYVMPYVRSWYLIAYCEWRKETLMFKIDRIREATLLNERYQVPEGFDLEEYLGPTWGIMRGKAGEPVDVVLRFEPEAGRWVAEELWHPSQQVEEQPDGTVLFRLHVAVTPELINWILYYGPRVEVLEPPELRKRVVEEHRRAVEVYESRSPPTS